MGVEPAASVRARLRAWLRPHLPGALTFAACAIAAMVLAAPIAVERAIEDVRITDHLGTFPVEVQLCHDGRSTFDTGLFGKVYWHQSGTRGFGVYARASGPPEAGGTLASYVDPEFVQANVAFIEDPRAVITAWSAKFADGLQGQVVRTELLAGLAGGTLLFLLLPRRRLRDAPAPHVIALASLLLAVGASISAAAALQLFRDWPCNHATGAEYAMPGVARLGFDSPETLEVAQQVKPFSDKNLRRISEEAGRYRAAAESSVVDELDRQRDELTPRPGERIVAAEADPQGSYVGARVRAHLYAELVDRLGPEAVALRTISGDVSSNGTIAEAAFVAKEAKVSPGIRTVAAGGDHDTDATTQQLEDGGVVVPDLETVRLRGLRVAGANDRERKSLFGGLISNPSGVTEQELGARLRENTGRTPRIVLLHQPDAAAGYLGLPSLAPIRSLDGSATIPYDDGIPDQPPGTINVGHLHEAAGPWVLWNTDGRRITWTVVDQLGTSGGVENRPTVNRFSTPESAPLKPLSVRLQFFNTESGLQTGYVSITCDTDGGCTIEDRVDVGLAGGQPEVVEEAPTE